MLIKAEAHNLDFTPDCPLNVLIAQIHHMGNYLHAMEVRAEYEGLTSASALRGFYVIWSVLRAAVVCKQRTSRDSNTPKPWTEK